MEQKTAVQFNDERRHALVGLQFDGKPYDIRGYNGLSYENLVALISEGFANTDETQNDSPSIGEILGFLRENPTFTAHGYIVTPDRDDVRVSIEGVAADEQPERESFDAFIDMFRMADEFNTNPPRAWYD